MARLLEQYRERIAPALRSELGIENPMATPRLRKVVVSMGLGSAIQDKKRMPSAVADLAAITGQQPVVCKARVSVSNFKLRKGYEIGAMVTLRGQRMYEFVDRLFNVAVPRMRDFRGLKTSSFDGRGNYSMGISDQTIFPEINLDKVEYRQGMNVTFVTSARDDAGARRLLTELGMPLKRSEDEEGK
ncbi:MAG TPA: 50S ribosomal protein L5 [Phycisphaerae bacterium]|nr:50S ribosomal protein L5 [Phycisphaerales bacterium]HRX85797.1 50S ribosomal protein L5 [Phycisphaerae bacterium]